MAAIERRDMNSQNSFQGRGALSRYDNQTFRYSGVDVGIFSVPESDYVNYFFCVLDIEVRYI